MTTLNTPDFTVIITCYNKVQTIAAAVASVRAQDIGAELVLVDDFSSDGSRDLLPHLEVDQLILHDKNKGALSAYLTGMRMATGRYLVMLDGDDQLAPGILVALLKSGWLNDRDCIRLGMAELSAGAHPAVLESGLERSITFRPGRLFTISQSTGGTAYVFPKALFNTADSALVDGWPSITVQDHVLPGVLGLLARKFIKLKTKGYLITPPTNALGLGKCKTTVHHDRLLSDFSILLAAEGPIHQKFMTRFLLRAALIIRIRTLARRYDFTQPLFLKLFWSTHARKKTVFALAQKILSTNKRT